MVINTNATNPLPIHLCLDSALLTGGNYGANNYSWTGPNGITSSSSSLEATFSGNYIFTVSNNSGCANSSSNTHVTVIIDSLYHPIDPIMICPQDGDGNDSIDLCTGHYFTMYVYDSISNPLAFDTCFADTVFLWTVTPASFPYSSLTDCHNYFTPTQSGLYTISCLIIRHNKCGSDTSLVSHTIYVNLLPVPVVTTNVSISGSAALCPGGTNLLVASGTPFVWFGPGVSGSTADSIYVTQPGLYGVSSSLTVTNSYGCTATSSSVATINVFTPPQPIITFFNSNGVICPNDSVELICTNGSGTFQWQGPNGPVGGNSNSVYVYNSGLYYCIVNDINGCALVSNTILVNQYTTPYLLATTTNILCPGGSLTISANTLPGSTIQWLPPLSGSNITQTVTSAGTYTCLITACGIQTNATITIVLSPIVAVASAAGPTTFCYGDSVIINANTGGNITGYLWQPGNSTQPSITATQTQTYTLTISDTNGCSVSTNISTTERPEIIGTVTTSPTNCLNNNGSATINASGGTGSLTYHWNTGAITNTITGLSTGTYTSSITDSIGCTSSASGTVAMSYPPANAGADVTIYLGNSTTLSATGGVSYVWTPVETLSCDSCAVTIATPLVTTTYTVTVTDSYGCKAIASVTVFIEVHCPTNEALEVPNAFSPNGDGYNDQFCLKGWTYCTNYFNIIIYDRWGEKVFESDIADFCWDGMYKGKLLDTDVFYYYITASLKNDQEMKRKGNISLIR